MIITKDFDKYKYAVKRIRRKPRFDITLIEVDDYGKKEIGIQCMEEN